MKFFTVAIAVTLGASSVSAFTLTMVNNCGETVWAAVGQAPLGQVKPPSAGGIAFGKELKPKASVSFQINDQALGVRAWGRTGCDAKGANCKTGRCNGGLVCTDAGITSRALLSEFGFADFKNFGGIRTAWDLSKVDGDVNVGAKLTSSDGQTVSCTKQSCVPQQAFLKFDDFTADRNSKLGSSFKHIFCP